MGIFLISAIIRQTRSKSAQLPKEELDQEVWCQSTPMANVEVTSLQKMKHIVKDIPGPAVKVLYCLSCVIPYVFSYITHISTFKQSKYLQDPIICHLN